MENKFELENDILLKYNSDGSGEVLVPQGVAVIAEYAFAGCEELRRIVIPSGVKEIGQKAFWGCTELREIILPEGLEIIGRFAFWECGSLTAVRIPDGVKSIGNSAFRGCDMLSSVVLPDSVENIGESCFSDCVSLSDINIPKGLRIIKKRVFSDCQGLEAIVIPDTADALDDYAFECCGNLKRAILSEGLKTIGKHCFSGCSSLKDIVVPKSVSYIGSSAFYKTALIDDADTQFVILGDGILVSCKNTCEKAVIPSQTRSIGERAFAYCEELKSVIVPEGVTEIGDYAFEHCTKLESITLPKSIARLGSRAFVDCTELSEVCLPDDLRRIGSDIFYGTRLLDEFTDDLMIRNGKYLISFTGSTDTFTAPEECEIIADSAFTGSNDLKSVILGSNVRVIGDKAFKWCGELNEINIPRSVEYIGREAFESSENIRVSFSCHSCKIGENAFPKGAVIVFCFDDTEGFSVKLKTDFVSSGPEAALFRFVCEPSRENFEEIKIFEYKASAALYFSDIFYEYLRENIKQAVCFAVENDDRNMLDRLLLLGYLSEKDAESCVLFAVDQKKPELQVRLMRYKQEKYGSKAVSDVIDSRFSL